MEKKYLLHFVARRKDDNYKHIHLGLQVVAKQDAILEVVKKDETYLKMQEDHIMELVEYHEV